MEGLVKCPICGKHYFRQRGNFEICPVCKWENDDIQMKHPDMAGGANKVSLNEYKKLWESETK